MSSGEPGFTIRYIWRIGRSCRAFQHFADGWNLFQRRHDAIGWFRVYPGGRLEHVWDDIPVNPGARY